MTASVVNGLRVIEDQPTASPYLRDKSGAPLIWHRTRTLLLEDGSVIYGCAECDYTNTNLNSIRPHQSRHSGRPRRNATGSRDAANAAALSLAELLRKLRQLDQVEADRDEWRRRAVAAEKSLALLRKALQP